MHVALTPTMADLCRPQRRLTGVAYDVAVILAGSVLIVLCSRLSVQASFSPVPITGQTFAVLLVGALLGSRRGPLAVGAFIAQGMAGVPVGAQGIVGLAWLLGPTGGYLLGFVLAAGVVGWLAERGWDRSIGRTIAAMSVGTLLIFLPGVMWLGFHARIIELLALRDVASISVGDVLAAGLWPFLPGAAVKIALAAMALPFGWKILSWGGGDPIPPHRNGA